MRSKGGPCRPERTPTPNMAHCSTSGILAAVQPSTPHDALVRAVF